MGRPCAVDASLGYGETDLLGRTWVNWEDMKKIFDYHETEELHLNDEYDH